MSIVEPNREAAEQKFREIFSKDISDKEELDKLSALAVDGELVATLIEPIIARVHAISDSDVQLATKQGRNARNMAWACIAKGLDEAIQFLEGSVAREINAAMKKAKKKGGA